MSLAAATPLPSHRRLLPGLALSIGLAALAFALGRALPLVGGAVLGIVLGLLVRNALTLPAHTAAGIRFSGKYLLQAAVILLGFGLDLGVVVHTGLSSLAVTLVTLAVAFLTAWALARLLKVHHVLGTLIGVGTAICGGSAIAAVAPILRPDEHDTALAMSTIFLFNLLAVLLFPPLGHLLGLSDAGFGLWAGTAINDTSSVVAAGYHYSHAAGDIATVVKLARATLIIPICLAGSRPRRGHQKNEGARRRLRVHAGGRRSVMQDEVGDDPGGRRHQQEIAGIAAPPVIAARRRRQLVVAPIFDHIGRAVARAIVIAAANPARRRNRAIHHPRRHRTVDHLAFADHLDPARRAVMPAPVVRVMLVFLPAIIAIMIVPPEGSRRPGQQRHQQRGGYEGNQAAFHGGILVGWIWLR